MGKRGTGGRVAESERLGEPGLGGLRVLGSWTRCHGCVCSSHTHTKHKWHVHMIYIGE